MVHLIILFKSGQYLLADSAYQLSQTVIPAYKAPAAYERSNAEFNFRLAKSRVRNEHTIGILKSRFASLKELRLHLYQKSHMLPYIKWIYSCMILHNMLSKLDDSWDSINADINLDTTFSCNHGRSLASENMRAEVKQKCLLHFGFR